MIATLRSQNKETIRSKEGKKEKIREKKRRGGIFQAKIPGHYKGYSILHSPTVHSLHWKILSSPECSLS